MPLQLAPRAEFKAFMGGYDTFQVIPQQVFLEHLRILTFNLSSNISFLKIVTLMENVKINSFNSLSALTYDVLKIF